MTKLEGIQACVFDAYGTLFDVASPVMKESERLGDKAPDLARLWRQKQLEYTWIRSLSGVHADFCQVTGDALDYTLATLKIDDPALRDALLTNYLTLNAYPDVIPALHVIKAKAKQTAILSNGSPAMIEAAVQAASLSKLIDHLFSVEEVGIYKPSRRVYRLALQKLHILDAPSICFISANGWDAHSAAHFGFQTVWLNRNNLTQDRLPGKLSATISDLSELPTLL